MAKSSGRKRVAIYARVSTDHQETANQVDQLREVAEQRGWQVVETYIDHAVSGAHGRDKRPALDRMLKDATRRRFDIVAAWAIDRLGRSVHKVSGVMAELEELGVAQFYHQQAIDSSTAAGRAMVQMCLVFAEFEREIIAERIKAGLSRARAMSDRDRAKAGKKKIGRPRVSAAKERAVIAARDEGKGIRKVAREVGVAVSVVQRIDKERSAAA